MPPRNHNSSAQRQHHYGALQPMETKNESKRWIAVYAMAGLAFAVMLYCGLMADLPELGA